MKKLKLLKLIREIKSLNKNDFHVIRINNDIDFSTMYDLSEYLDKKNIEHVIVRNDFDIKSLAADDKKELLEYIKKEIGLED